MWNRFVMRGLLGLAFLCASALPALAVQSSRCMPTSGIVTGLLFAEAINAGLAAGTSTNSGAGAPTNDCSGVTITGQAYWDTSLSAPALRYWDGTQGLAIGQFDLANHIFMPVMGGGVATLTAAATTDLCSVPQTYLTINGSTTIVSFGSSCQVGQEKDLNFSGTTTIAYSSSAILIVGSQSVTTGAGAQAKAVYLGGGIWQLRDVQTPGGAFQPGQMTYTAGSTPDPGFLFCSGTASRATYAALFARIGTTYGSGDGSTTFGLPDDNGRTIIGVDHASAGRVTTAGGNFDSTVLGNSGGSQSKVVAQTYLAPFTMTGTGTLTLNLQSSGGSNTSYSGNGAYTTSTTYNLSVSVPSGGGNTPFPTMQPSIALNCEIKY
jgi:microcystin-dependent protein